MKTDVGYCVRACVACQRAKVHHHVLVLLEQFIIPERRFDHVNIDLVGPFPPFRGYTHLLTMVDRTTGWPEAVPLTSTTAAEVVRALISTWVARFRGQADVSSDRGGPIHIRVIDLSLPAVRCFPPPHDGLSLPSQWPRRMCPSVYESGPQSEP